MIKIARCPFFTLMEMLIVMFILSLGVIVTGVKIRQAYQEQRFLSQCQQILNQLILAQDLMLILDADVHVNIQMDPETSFVKLKLDIEKPFTDAWIKLVEREMTFSAIRSYLFTNEDSKRSHEGPLVLDFVWGQMTQGTLTFFEGKNADIHDPSARYFKIELAGYPSAPRRKQLNQEGGRRESHSQLYPVEVYEKLYKDHEHDIHTP